VSPARHGSEPSSEVIVTLASPPVAGRTGARAGSREAVDREQARFASALHDAIPGATIHWRYRLVLNGAAVVVPNSALGRCERFPACVRSTPERPTR
jgi:hypothetical protein